MQSQWQLEVPVSLSHPLYDWLTEPDSMTVRLRQASNNTLAVKVLDARWTSSSLFPNESVWLRTVHLYGENKLWVYGHTLIPKSTIEASGIRFDQLGTTPLGDWLFQSKDLKKNPLEYCELDSTENLFKEAMKGIEPETKTLFARRTTFLLNQHPLIVTEVFLPALSVFLKTQKVIQPQKRG